MSSITINDTTYSGKNVSVRGSKVIVNGINVTPNNTLKVNIIVEGNIDTLDVDEAEKIAIEGTVGSVKTQSGDVYIKGNVNGDVNSTSGTINCGDVKENVKTTSGTVKCRNVGGNVKTVSGSIKRKI